MSHVVTGQIFVTDLDCLRAAVAKFPKLKWMEGQKTWEWVGRFFNDYHQADAAYKNGIDPKDYGHSEHAIKMEGSSFEVGVMKRADGSGYSLVWDFIGDGQMINQYIGAAAEHLLTEYARQTLLAACQQQGMTYQEEFLPNGELVVTMNQY